MVGRAWPKQDDSHIGYESSSLGGRDQEDTMGRNNWKGTIPGA